MRGTSAKEDRLTERDYEMMDTFIEAVLDDYKSGTITQAQAASGLAHVMAALDTDNYGEVRSWHKQGREFIRGKS